MRLASFLLWFSLVSLALLLPRSVFAVEDPLTLPNNRSGIHILFPSELSEAQALVNSSGGEWGYVVIPIQSGDRDLKKWQDFMDECREKKLIPIVRLATEGDYFNTAVWRKPREEDILDFANFLNSLSWPVKNRYIIVFNEVNRDDEWGGKANPAEYARLLSYSSLVFKALNENFFIISSGMDNASINGNGAINQFDYFTRMNLEVPGIFNQVDGISSHAYPNPGFSSPPTATHRLSIASFRYERDHISSMSNKTHPVFITETGWSGETLSDEMRSEYYDVAFRTVWNDPGIVTVAPFLLLAGGGPFQHFSFVNVDGSKTKQYERFRDMTKVKGTPSINKFVLGEKTVTDASLLPVKQFTKDSTGKIISKTQAAMYTFSFFFGL